MTLDERAAAVLNDIANSVDSETSLAIIRRALIEQDKITRHAAADDVAALSDTRPSATSPRVGDFVYEINLKAEEMQDKAHSAVMNCRGGVE